MYDQTSLWGRRGVTIAAIGAVETALWDIAGKILRKPVSELIWRSFAAIGVPAEIKSKVRPYTTAYPPGGTDDEIRERMRTAADRGFRAVKFEESKGGFGHGTLKEDVRLVKLVRDVIGDQRDLMVDVQNAWTDVGQAIATCKAIEPLNVYFVEAPFAPDNLEAYRRLADAVDVRIAAGDWGYTTRFDYMDLMEQGGVDVVQPSTVRSGGISEIMKIAEIAWRRGRLCIPHSWNHMIGVAAAVHIAAVVPNMPYFEFPTEFPESPAVRELLVPPLKPDADGMIEVPKRPGLGFTLNEDVVSKYRRNLS
jgi:L-alanine-DL-glutamate epimerase-like enolase superfamily enzyme